ncbi:MAG: hypothetical protein WAW36_19215 [Methylovulum miyakonense]
MNPKDVAILILSVILHDIGMHTEYATFVALLDGHYDIGEFIRRYHARLAHEIAFNGLTGEKPRNYQVWQ